MHYSLLHSHSSRGVIARLPLFNHKGNIMSLDLTYTNLMGSIQTLLREVDAPRQTAFFKALDYRLIHWLKPTPSPLQPSDFPSRFNAYEWGVYDEETVTSNLDLERSLRDVDHYFCDLITSILTTRPSDQYPDPKKMHAEILKTTQVLGTLVELRVIYSLGQWHTKGWRIRTALDFSCIEYLYEIQTGSGYEYKTVKQISQSHEKELWQAITHLSNLGDRKDNDLLKQMIHTYGYMTELLADLSHHNAIETIYDLINTAISISKNDFSAFSITKVGQQMGYGQAGEAMTKDEVNDHSLRFFGTDIIDTAGRCIARAS